MEVIASIMSTFADTLKVLDETLAGFIVLIVPTAGLLISHWLREQYLKMKVRIAVLESELEHGGDASVETKMHTAVSRIAVPSVLGATKEKLKKLIQTEQETARDSNRPVAPKPEDLTK